ncbi:MAG: hypothetical protein M1381_02730 [Deltaproteobacteria bacterium]|nr:hypothetical protein [Deltaproteobacteria bacterium]
MFRITKNLFYTILIASSLLMSCTKHQSGKPVLELYVMSHCPFGINAENTIIRLMPDFKNAFSLRIHYIVSKDVNGDFTSLHGPQELNEDLVQIAIQKFYRNKFYNYLLCYNSTMNDDKCSKDNGINKNKITSFVKSGYARQMLDKDFTSTEKLGINASPTLFINNNRYKGPMQMAHLTRAICADYAALPYCKTLKPPVSVNVTILEGGWTDLYHPNMISQSIGNFFYKSTVNAVDVKTKEGKELSTKFNIKEVPALIFSDDVTMTTSFGLIKTRLKEVDGDYIDYMNDFGYRYLPARPVEKNQISIFFNLDDKAAINAAVSLLKLLVKEKKYYNTTLHVMGISYDDTELIKTVSVINRANGMGVNDQINMLEAILKSPSLKDFNKQYRVKYADYNDIIKTIQANNNTVKGLGIKQNTFIILVDNTNLIAQANPMQSVGILELSPVIGKQGINSSSMPGGGQCAK